MTKILKIGNGNFRVVTIATGARKLMVSSPVVGRLMSQHTHREMVYFIKSCSFRKHSLGDLPRTLAYWGIPNSNNQWGVFVLPDNPFRIILIYKTLPDLTQTVAHMQGPALWDFVGMFTERPLHTQKEQ